jgi:diacylglycerol kinase (ATP)
MKGQSFHKRLGYAWRGVLCALNREQSFRTQGALGGAALLFTVWLSPPLIWIALVAVMLVLVLGAELFNTALEHALDGLHPGQAEFVRLAKDCAAAAVLIFSAGSVVVFGLMLGAVWQ